ncbi:hypothetical protein ACFX13_034638 [Malus domestica]
MSLSKPINISILPQMSVERNRRGRCGIGGRASDDDVEEEKVGSRDREEEVTCVAHDLQRPHITAALDDVATLDKMFVRLRVVEALHHRPYGPPTTRWARAPLHHSQEKADPPPFWFWYCDDAVFDVAEVAMWTRWFNTEDLGRLGGI